MNNQKNAGFTLVELLIVVTLSTVVIGGAIRVAASGARASATQAVAERLDSEARQTLDRVGRLLRTSLAAEILGGDPGLDGGTDWVQFTRPGGFENGAIVPGEVDRLELRATPTDPWNGLDDDDDGLIDEGRLVLIRDVGLPSETTGVLCEPIARSQVGEMPGNNADDNGNGLTDEPGLAMTVEGREVTVRLTLADVDSAGALVTRGTRRTVLLRN